MLGEVVVGGVMENTEVYLSVIIPCYNEEENLRRGVLEEVKAFLTEQKYRWEVIVVDDGSTDASLHLIRRFVSQEQHFKVRTINHGGKPVAIWEGINQTTGMIVLFTDMDQSTPICELEKLLPWYNLGFEVVIGSRGIQRRGFSALRQVGSFVFRTLRRFLLLWEVIDTQCGFKSCTRPAALEIFWRLSSIQKQIKPRGWKVSAFDVEFLYLMRLRGYKIKEVTVEWENRDTSVTKTNESSSKRYLRESAEMLWEIIRIQVNKLRNNY